MRRPLRFKPTLRETLARNNAADRFYAASFNKEPMAQSAIAAKRAYTKRSDRNESDVLREIGALLATHPRVLWALRVNSGAASYMTQGGRQVPIWFTRWMRSPDKMRVVDILGATTDARILAIEAKPPTWKSPRDDREHEQAAFLDIVRRNGGIGIFATDVDDVSNALAATEATEATEASHQAPSDLP